MKRAHTIILAAFLLLCSMATESIAENVAAPGDSVTAVRAFVTNFGGNGISVIDVSRRAIEETSAAILELYRGQREGT